MPALWTVEVVERGSDKVVKEIPCGASERAAEKVERGVNINLNHEAFYTRLVSDAAAPAHDVRSDAAGFGSRERLTCHGCAEKPDTIVRQPHHTDTTWSAAKARFLELHPVEVRS